MRASPPYVDFRAAVKRRRRSPRKRYSAALELAFMGVEGLTEEDKAILMSWHEGELAEEDIGGLENTLSRPLNRAVRGANLLQTPTKIRFILLVRSSIKSQTPTKISLKKKDEDSSGVQSQTPTKIELKKKDEDEEGTSRKIELKSSCWSDVTPAMVGLLEIDGERVVKFYEAHGRVPENLEEAWVPLPKNSEKFSVKKEVF